MVKLFRICVLLFLTAPLLMGCELSVKNDPPAKPTIAREGEYTPVILKVTCSDPDGDRLCYQLEYWSAQHFHRYEWTSFFNSGTPVYFALTEVYGPTYITVVARDEMNEQSPAGEIELDIIESPEPPVGNWYISLQVDFILNSFCFVGKDNCWAVGYRHALIKTDDGGRIWEETGSGIDEDLHDIVFVDELTGWAVGNNGGIFHSSDGGVSWSRQDSGVSYKLTDVFFINNLKGWASGEVNEANNEMLATVDGGTTWVKQKPGIMRWVTDTFFIDENTGWLTSYTGKIMRTDDGGSSWREQFQRNDGMIEVMFIDLNTGAVACMNGSFLYTVDGGETWLDRSPVGADNIHGMYMTGPTTAWMAGGRQILHSDDAGAHWVNGEYSLETVSLGKTIFTDSVTGWILGTRATYGILLHSTNAGIEESSLVESEARETNNNTDDSSAKAPALYYLRDGRRILLRSIQ